MARWRVPSERCGIQFLRDRFDSNLSLEGVVLPRPCARPLPPERPPAKEGGDVSPTGEPHVLVAAYASPGIERWTFRAMPFPPCVATAHLLENRMSKTDFVTPDNSAVVLIDYQPAMYQGVQSHDRLGVVHNVQVLAKAAQVFGLPIVLSTVAKDSFSGPFMPEVTELFPKVKVVDRTSINAWLDAVFRDALKATKRKKIILAGLWTEACVMFPSLDLLAAGYEVYVPTDACGDVTPEAHERAVARLVQAGAVPVTSLQVLFELQQDWARGETYGGVMDILKAHSPYGIQVRFSKWALGEHASEGA